MIKYTFFYNGPFSNWYPAKFKYKDIEFNNSEQAFMWEKAMFFKDTLTANSIVKCNSPKEAKELGRKVLNYNDAEWANVRYDYMFDVCLCKFSQNKYLKNILIEKENFVEASPYDRIWGIGLSEQNPDILDPENWNGLNLLGEVLNDVRTTILETE